MHATLSSLALGLVAIAGLTQATMIPNAKLGFVLPPAEAQANKVTERDASSISVGTLDITVFPNAGKFDRHTSISNAEELSAPATKRDESRPYEKRTMIPNSELGFVLPAAEAKLAERDVKHITVYPNAGKFERHTKIEFEGKSEEVARAYEKRTMIPNSKLGFVLPSEPKLASRSAAWQRVAKA
jgi:hypothetical protein